MKPKYIAFVVLACDAIFLSTPTVIVLRYKKTCSVVPGSAAAITFLAVSFLLTSCLILARFVSYCDENGNVCGNLVYPQRVLMYKASAVSFACKAATLTLAVCFFRSLDSLCFLSTKTAFLSVLCVSFVFHGGLVASVRADVSHFAK